VGEYVSGRRKINLSTVFAGQYVGAREVADEVWLASFLDYDLGFVDRELNKVEPVGKNPFAPKVLPMLPE
jgi:putative transposase